MTDSDLGRDLAGETTGHSLRHAVSGGRRERHQMVMVLNGNGLM